MMQLTSLPRLGSLALLTSTLLAAGVGLLSGFSSGLCGVSPGGALVVLSTLFLGAEQHIAQGISLAVQIPPTSLSGIRRYREAGGQCPTGWILWLAFGFLLGGPAGAIGATDISGPTLQWSYFVYLVALDALVVLRPAAQSSSACERSERISASSLFVVGLVAGASSGYLGIGGGLAVVVGLAGVLGVPQHRAQMISLILSIVPTTIPAAYVYWRAGDLASWPILLAVVIGLWSGTDLGARAATRLSSATLRRVLVITVAFMAVYMAWKALDARL
jgi:uncharacterized protein